MKFSFLVLLSDFNVVSVDQNQKSLFRTPKRVTSGGAYLRGLGPGLHSSEVTSQWWRAVRDTVPI